MKTGRVYSIRSHLRPDLVYIGSTKETLSRRLAQHKTALKQYQAGKHRCVTSFEIIKLGDAYVELIQLVEYKEKCELHAAERKCIRETDCVNKYMRGECHVRDKKKCLYYTVRITLRSR